jgi:GxxExxY protein
MTLENFPFKDQTYNIIGIRKEVHRVLDHWFLEIVYQDAIEYELMQLDYGREKEYVIKYKDVILPHNFFADFVIGENIILEVKAAEGGISNQFISRMLNYLKVSKCKLGLIVNFGRSRLEVKRLIF